MLVKKVVFVYCWLQNVSAALAQFYTTAVQTVIGSNAVRDTDFYSPLLSLLNRVKVELAAL
jgi:hypothetical protein